MRAAHHPARQLILLVLLLLGARVLFIAAMPATYSYDLYAWLDATRVLKQHGNPYESGTFCWPPFWMQVLYVLSRINDATGISSIRLIQGVLILAEALSLILLYRIIRRYFPQARPFPLLLWGLVLNPICILLSCQHCNFDVFVGLCILLFVQALLEYHQRQSPVAWLVAAFFLGLGIFTKTVPFILLPVLCIGMRPLDGRTRLFGFALVLLPVLIGMGTLYPLAQAAVDKYVLGYRSLSGWYGFTGLLQLAGWGQATAFYSSCSPLVFAGVMGFTGWHFRNAAFPPGRLVALAAAVLLFINAFGPGYSPPYILWFLPLLLLLFATAGSHLRGLLIAGYIIAAATYTIEYACFESHGAFLAHLTPQRFSVADSKAAGSITSQVLIRLPLFCFYLLLFGGLVQRLRRTTTGVL